jgi:hypothetical protein
VVRVSWNAALAFCRWLSEKTGERCGLPTEAQWEYQPWQPVHNVEFWIICEAKAE